MKNSGHPLTIKYTHYLALYRKKFVDLSSKGSNMLETNWHRGLATWGHLRRWHFTAEKERDLLGVV